MVYLPICLHGKLHIVAIGPLQQTDALDLADGKGLNVPGANEANGSNAVPEGVV